MDFFSSNFTLGILGGGQLGKMLLQETRKWDIKTAVMDASPDAPARLSCDCFVQGDLMDKAAVVAFGRTVDVLTIEIENVSLEGLQQLENEGIKVFPSSKTLHTIQNKIRQKEFYKSHQIPTAAFQVYESVEALESAISDGSRTLPAVWKSPQFGYDGYGVKVLRTIADLQSLPKGKCLVEDKVEFITELAVIVASNPRGETVAYPVVEMLFHPEANQVEYVLCPARVSNEIAHKANEIALNVSKAYQHIGLLAVELFLTASGDLLVNEVAPRPHNSGHYSIEGSYTSQFEQHLRAVLDMPLGETKSKQPAAMTNLNGAAGYSGPVWYDGMEEILKIEGVVPHIYGKKETRPFRKMGHATVLNQSLENAYHLAEKVKNTLQIKTK